MFWEYPGVPGGTLIFSSNIGQAYFEGFKIYFEFHYLFWIFRKNDYLFYLFFFFLGGGGGGDF